MNDLQAESDEEALEASADLSKFENLCLPQNHLIADAISISAGDYGIFKDLVVQVDNELTVLPGLGSLIYTQEQATVIELLMNIFTVPIPAHTASSIFSIGLDEVCCVLLLNFIISSRSTWLCSLLLLAPPPLLTLLRSFMSICSHESFCQTSSYSSGWSLVSSSVPALVCCLLILLSVNVC